MEYSHLASIEQEDLTLIFATSCVRSVGYLSRKNCFWLQHSNAVTRRIADCGGDGQTDNGHAVPDRIDIDPNMLARTVLLSVRENDMALRRLFSMSGN